uniref:NAD_Gly3P_dh_C domain-containing protein n=1 Tax=Macrostomum lignano TaxID=282301 RepID=A0A1I8FDE8_9PLAT
IIENEFSVEICGALKSIVATGPASATLWASGTTQGCCDPAGLHGDTAICAAVLRLRWRDEAHTDAELRHRDIISSCYNTKDVKWAATHDGSGPLGMHDLVTTCYGGRNRKLGEAMVLTGKPLRQLEKEMLDGQPEVHRALQEEGQLQRFPLMVAVHLICSGQMKPRDFIEQLREHPEHINIEKMLRNLPVITAEKMRHSVWMLQLLLLLLWQPPCDCVSISRDKR